MRECEGEGKFDCLGAAAVSAGLAAYAEVSVVGDVVSLGAVASVAFDAIEAAVVLAVND